MAVDSYRQPGERELLPPIPLNRAKFHFFAAIITTLSFCGWVATRIILVNTFDNGCDYFISSAREATNPAAAARELDKAIAYIDENGMDQEYTTIAPFRKSPEESQQLWREKLVAVRDRLADLADRHPEDSAEPLAATLINESSFARAQGSFPHTPQGVSLYGHNTSIFYWFLLSVIGTPFFWIAYGATKPHYEFW